jgi:hypothetical protein
VTDARRGHRGQGGRQRREYVLGHRLGDGEAEQHGRRQAQGRGDDQK